MIDNGRPNADTLFTQRFEYHRDLTKRRWQYFATFLVLDGLFFNVYFNKTATSNVVQAIIAASAIFISVATLRLVSRTRTRLLSNGRALNKLAQEAIVDTGKAGTTGWGGITVWLLLSIIALSAPWLYFLLVSTYSGGEIAFTLGGLLPFILYCINLYDLRWKL